MLQVKGYCPNCPCWFDVPDKTLAANRLCPCCLTPAKRLRRGPAVILRVTTKLRGLVGAAAAP